MLFALGAASSAIDLLSSLGGTGSSTSSGKPGFVPANAFSLPDSSTPSPTPGSSGGGQLSPDTMSTLLAAQSQGQTAATSRSAALKDLFSLIDTDGDGGISKEEFEAALGAGGTNLQAADDVFGKMDLDGNDSVSMDEMSQSLRGGGRHHHAGGAGAGNNDALMQALQGASSNSTTNSDGSTTTTLTYADGTTVTMTQPASSSSSTSNSATQSYNFIERLIERQAQAIAANAQQSLSMSV